jgi:HAD superfamily phosphatase (TIGR01668 family)
MKSNLIPSMHVDSPYELDTEILRNKGVQGIIIDIDNTLVPWGTKYADQKVIDLIGKLKAEGFKLCILSNSTRKRVSIFNKDIRLPEIHNAGKPSRAAFRKAIALLGTEPGRTAVIGDQIFTDILGGNRLGLFTVLVVPMSSKEFIWTRLVRQVEKLIMRRYKHLINKND